MLWSSHASRKDSSPSSSFTPCLPLFSLLLIKLLMYVHYLHRKNKNNNWLCKAEVWVSFFLLPLLRLRLSSLFLLLLLLLAPFLSLLRLFSCCFVRPVASWIELRKIYCVSVTSGRSCDWRERRKKKVDGVFDTQQPLCDWVALAYCSRCVAARGLLWSTVTQWTGFASSLSSCSSLSCFLSFFSLSLLPLSPCLLLWRW